MGILNQIIETKKAEIQAKRELRTMDSFRREELFGRKALSLKANLLKPGSTGIIAEFKRKSPSRGWFHPTMNVLDVVTGYVKNEAAGLSILTDVFYFGGANQDIVQAREKLDIPILRKEFIIDPLQVFEAKAIGADVVLLIAACLSPAHTKELAAAAKEVGLEVLLEIHSADEINRICDEIDIVGINNRNLDTLQVSVQTSFDLIREVGPERPLISESGITDPATILSLRKAGFKGFLIGENFMKQPDPAIAFADFVTTLKQSHED